jgi:hypothetical protein
METRPASEDPPREPLGDDQATQKAIRELLELLPADVLDEINAGKIDIHDPAFLEGLTDHVSRQSLADLRTGQRMIGKIKRLKKQIARSLRESDPGVPVSSTIARTGVRVGRNEPCPCGSGRKFKQCCMRK